MYSSEEHAASKEPAARYSTDIATLAGGERIAANTPGYPGSNQMVGAAAQLNAIAAPPPQPALASILKGLQEANNTIHVIHDMLDPILGNHPRFMSLASDKAEAIGSAIEDVSTRVDDMQALIISLHNRLARL